MTLHVASVPHTATIFTQELLGLTDHAHIPDPKIEKWLDSGDQVVFPLRDPVLAYITQLNRSNNDRLAHHFSVMANYVQRPNTHVFRVDVPDADRPAELAKLEAFTGLKLHTDWLPIHATGIDPRGLKHAYNASGAMDDQCRKFVASLQRPVFAMLERYGYAMPWLKYAEPVHTGSEKPGKTPQVAA